MKSIAVVLFFVAISLSLPSVNAQLSIEDCEEQTLFVTSEVTDTTITLFWTEATQCKDGLEIKALDYRGVVRLGDDVVTSFETNELSILLDGLNPGTEYEFMLVAIFFDAPVQIVNITVTTNETVIEEPETPRLDDPCVEQASPTGFQLSATSDTITVTWNDDAQLCVEGVAIQPDKYSVLNLQTGIAVPDASSGVVITSLEINTAYDIKLFTTYIEPELRAILQATITTDDGSADDGSADDGPAESLELVEDNGSGCSGDCTPPTIGLDEIGKRLVENGFSYNNNPVDVIAWHTPYPLITAIVNQTNTVEIIAYDNGGIFNLDMIQFGLGIEEFGQPLHDIEVLIEVHLEAQYSENKVIVEKVVIRDSDNLIDTFTVFAVTETVECADDGLDNDCLKVTLQYAYREATINNMMGVNVVDRSLNTQNFYLNHGVEVIGESMNPAPFVVLPNKQTSQQTENLTKTLVRTDKVNHLWMDEYGVEYLKTGDNKFDRITPAESYTCNDPLLSEINVPTRANCNFRALTTIWDN